MAEDSFSIRINKLLDMPPYSLSPEEHAELMFELLKSHIQRAAELHLGYQNYVDNFPIRVEGANCIAELPYLPVRIFKNNDSIALVESTHIKHVFTSSATTGQIPSSIPLDSDTSSRMSNGISNIIGDFIGKDRRPYLVVDSPDSIHAKDNISGARGAAIRGLMPFAKNITFCLSRDDEGNLKLNIDRVIEFAEKNRNKPVLIYGFTHIIWSQFVKPLQESGICLDLSQAHILHSGGWKRLTEEKVDKVEFNRILAEIFGCSPQSVIDFYGMVENLGVIYPDCTEGNKHVPAFGYVLIRSLRNLEPVEIGETGIIQVCSGLPTSFPGHLLLTEDLGTLIHTDHCQCGRRGVAFKFSGRVQKSEIRGCGNIRATRSTAQDNS